ncbi:MAG: hypothetical protein FK734_19615 [Asgard group archaeon]|nr:hypothetical protein [Asgard group archaeon]
MNLKRLNTIITISLIILVIPITTTLVIGLTEPSTNISVTGTDFYHEDFTTTTYEKNPESTVFGWGQGYVSEGRNFTFNPLDNIPTAVPVTELEINGRIGYALFDNPVLGSDQIMTFSCADPTNIFTIDTSLLYRSGSALDTDGIFLYTGQYHTSGNLFGTYNVSDPTFIALQYSYVIPSNGIITDIESEGRYVYYINYNGTGASSLACYDAKNPALVSFPFYSTFPETLGLGLTVEGRLAYIAASTEGLYIVNVTNIPNTPTVGHVAITGNATDVIVDGRYAYVAAGYEGIFVVDVFDPTQPEIIGAYDTDGYCRRLAKQGNSLIIADGIAGITILDVVNPYHPVRVMGIGAGYTYDVALYGGIVGAATESNIYLFELGASSGVTNLNRANFINVFDDYQAWDVQIQGNIAYIAGGPDGFYTLDVRYPEAPVLLDRWFQGGLSFKRLDVDGQYAYLIDTQNIVIFDISNPENIRHLTTVTLLSPGVTDCFALGHELYMSWGGGSVVLFDISFPATTDLTDAKDELIIGTNISALWGQGRHIFAVDNAGISAPAIYTISARDPSNLAVTDAYSVVTFMNDIFVDGEVAYTANIYWTITFDIKDPINILYCNSPSTSYCQGVVGFGQYMLTADKIDGLTMYDATNIYSLTPISQVSELTGGMQVKTHGDYTYYVNQSGLSILRHYESMGDTYDVGISIAESKTIKSVEGMIKEAVLDANVFIQPGTNIEFQMSADGGVHWETVTLGIGHTFTNPGNDLRWRAILQGETYRSPYIYDLSIECIYNLQPTKPIIEDLGDTKFTGVFTVKWNATDDIAIDHYELEVSDSLTFTTTLKSWVTTKPSKMVFGLGSGTYYFRARAFDDEGLVSTWSFVENVDITLSTTISGVIFGGGLLIIITIIVVVSVVVRKKRQKVPVR